MTYINFIVIVIEVSEEKWETLLSYRLPYFTLKYEIGYPSVS
jgi:hypothetical protein